MTAEPASRDADRAAIRPGSLVDAGVGRTWDARADSWGEVADTAAFRGFRDAVLGEAALGPGDHVLDLGCGTGLLAIPIGRICGRVTAVDASVRMLERLRMRADQAGIHDVDLIHGDVRRLPVETACADAVVSCYAFHHLDHSEKLDALAEVARVLRPGGRLVIADMMFGLSLASRDRAIVAEKVRLLLRLGPAGAWRLARNGARLVTRRWEHPASLEWWQRALEQSGFERVAVRPLVHEAGLAVATKPAGGAALGG